MPRTLLLLFGAFQIVAAEPKLHTFERLTLSTEYLPYSHREWMETREIVGVFFVLAKTIVCTTE